MIVEENDSKRTDEQPLGTLTRVMM